MRVNWNEVAKEVTIREGKIRVKNIGDCKEVIGLMADVLYEKFEADGPPTGYAALGRVIEKFALDRRKRAAAEKKRAANKSCKKS